MLLVTLKAKLTEIFPSLKDTEISHCWTGFTGFSFSKLPHIGYHNGIYHAIGHYGNDEAMAPYLGHKAALKMLHPQQPATATLSVPTNALTKPHVSPHSLLVYAYC